MTTERGICSNIPYNSHTIYQKFCNVTSASRWIRENENSEHLSYHELPQNPKRKLWQKELLIKTFG